MQHFKKCINVVLIHTIHLWEVCLADITYFAFKKIHM